jgi:hypothetical protein
VTTPTLGEKAHELGGGIVLDRRVADGLGRAASWLTRAPREAVANAAHCGASPFA